MDKPTWDDLAQQQHDAALDGGERWLRFVGYAERLTGLHWDTIRDHPEMTRALKRFYSLRHPEAASPV